MGVGRGRRLGRAAVAVVMVAVSMVPAATGQAQPPLDGGGGWTNYPDLDGGDIGATPGTWNTLADVQAAFVNARTIENADLCPGGVCEPNAQVMPTNLTFPPGYAALTPNEKGLWLLNQERVARGLLPFAGIDAPVAQVAQAWAQHLSDTDLFEHNANRHAQIVAACVGCAGNIGTFPAENLATRSRWGTPAATLHPFGIEHAIYAWMYDDLSSRWGHRHALLWNNLSNDHGDAGTEGFVGFGIVRKPITVPGFAGGESEMVVWNAIDSNALYPAAPVTCNGLAVTVDIGAGGLPTAGADVIVGTPGPDAINGLGGNDSICGLGGADTINAGPGVDTVFAGDGDDTVFGGDGVDTLRGEAGTDTIQGNVGADVIDGGEGDDTLSGNDGDDTITGAGGDDTIYGVGGADVIGGGAGIDTVLGGLGNDQIDGGDGNDALSGNTGNDTVGGGAGDDAVYGVDGDDTLAGGGGVDLILGGLGADGIDGGDDNDLLSGNAGDDTVDGGAGDDEVYGADGLDTLTGGFGEDVILGGNNDDRIDSLDGEADQTSGNAGTDTCTPDATLDTFFSCEIVVGGGDT